MSGESTREAQVAVPTLTFEERIHLLGLLDQTEVAWILGSVAGTHPAIFDSILNPEQIERARRGDSEPMCGKCRTASVDMPNAATAGELYVYARFCADCIDRCHESTDFAHSCVICVSHTADRGAQ